MTIATDTEQAFVPARAAALSLQDISTHDAKWTIRNIATGERRTFRVATQKADAKFAPGKRIISYLVGSNNQKDYKGLAFVFDSEVKAWTKTKESAKLNGLLSLFASCAALKYAGGRVTEDKLLGYEIAESCLCRMCGRELTADSIALGIGPKCAKKAGL